MVSQIYPTVLRLNQAEFLRQNYDKRDDINFEIVNFPFLDGDVPCSTFYDVYISQLIRFARVCSHVVDLNNKN